MLHLCTSRSAGINLAVPSAIHFSQTNRAMGSGRCSRISCEISFIGRTPLQGAPDSHGDLHAPELQEKKDKREPHLVKGRRGDLK